MKTRSILDLTGEWRFALDRDDQGEHEQWFSRELADRIPFPASLAERRIGDTPSKTTAP